MAAFDILGLIPPSFQAQLLGAVVDFVSGLAAEVLGGRASRKIANSGPMSRSGAGLEARSKAARNAAILSSVHLEKRVCPAAACATSCSLRFIF